MPMSDALPPLTALRAFEAAARHMSFARAADELHVTPAALSFQIKSLEAHLGQPVFRRLNRAVELTEAGRTLLPGTRDGFAALGAAWRAARRLLDSRVLSVTAGPAVTAKWLAPRLFDFAGAHPDIELRFAASLRVMDLTRDEVDVALRFGVGADGPGHYVRPIIREWLTPMMTPALAARLRSPEDLRDATLFHQADIDFLRPRADWPAWFRAAGLGPCPDSGPRFSQSDHAIDAALAGGGVILGRVSLTATALRAGQLVAPFPVALITDAHYRFVCLDGQQTRPQIAAFHDWLLAEARLFEPLAEGRRFVAAA